MLVAVLAEFQPFLDSHPNWGDFTRSCRQQWVERLVEFLSERGRSWQNCRSTDLEAYRQQLLWKTYGDGHFYSPNTIDQAQRSIRDFYRWALAQGHVHQDPTTIWILARIPKPSLPVLTREQTLQLLNAPDLGLAPGQRDHLLLELLYSGQLSLTECCALQLDQLHPHAIQLEPRCVALQNGLAASLERYLKQGRPRLLGQATPAVLLTHRGQPYTTLGGLRAVLRGYQNRLKLLWPISASLLHRSHRAHLEELTQRRLRLL